MHFTPMFLPAGTLRFAGLLIAGLMVSGPASSHPRGALFFASGPVVPIKIRAVQFADQQPRVRIRGDKDGKGLSPKAFVRWLARHPAFAPPLRPGGLTPMLATAGAAPASAFDKADMDDNGRISATELADFLARQPTSVSNDRGSI